ncbi:Copia protein, partial [Mucuna pruriens]
MVETLRIDKHLVHLQSFFKNMGLFPSTLCLNGVAERRNRTLIDMVRSMRSNANFPQFLWNKALKTTMYILNRVPTNVVLKTPFELLKDWKPSLQHIRI